MIIKSKKNKKKGLSEIEKKLKNNIETLNTDIRPTPKSIFSTVKIFQQTEMSKIEDKIYIWHKSK